MVHCLFIKLITKIPRLLFTVPWWARLPVFPCFEEIIAMGAKKFVLFGSCGVLDDNKVDGNIIIPVSAVRDEGTSYHYIAPSVEIEAEEHLSLIHIFWAVCIKLWCSVLRRLSEYFPLPPGIPLHLRSDRRSGRIPYFENYAAPLQY